MLDFKTYSQALGVLQMTQDDEERNEALLEQYKSYLEMEEDMRTNFEDQVKQRVQPAVTALARWIEDDS